MVSRSSSSENPRLTRRLDKGDSGIGRAAAQMFAREGADVTIVYLKEEEEE